MSAAFFKILQLLRATVGHSQFHGYVYSHNAIWYPCYRASGYKLHKNSIWAVSRAKCSGRTKHEIRPKPQKYPLIIVTYSPVRSALDESHFGSSRRVHLTVHHELAISMFEVKNWRASWSRMLCSSDPRRKAKYVVYQVNNCQVRINNISRYSATHYRLDCQCLLAQDGGDGSDTYEPPEDLGKQGDIHVHATHSVTMM